MIQCTHEEIAAVLDVSSKTLARRKQFAEVYKKGQENGRQSLRRAQWKSAMNGNVTMQIWLGKQWLGQKEIVTTEHTGNLDIGPNPARPDLSSKLRELVEKAKRPEADRIAFDQLAQALGARGSVATRPENLRTELTRFLDSQEVSLIHVPIVGGSP